MQEYGPDVVRIRFRLGEDWTGDPAIFFNLVVTGDSVKTRRYFELTREIRNRLQDMFGFPETGYMAFTGVRGESEQANIKDPAWD